MSMSPVSSTDHNLLVPQHALKRSPAIDDLACLVNKEISQDITDSEALTQSDNYFRSSMMPAEQDTSMPHSSFLASPIPQRRLIPLVISEDEPEAVGTPDSQRGLHEDAAFQVYQAKLRERMQRLLAVFPPAKTKERESLLMRAVGREVTEEDRNFYERVKEAMLTADDPSLPSDVSTALRIRRIRGTYIISELVPPLEKPFHSLNPTEKKSLKVMPLAVFKPCDEVRGGENHPGDNPAKFGINPLNEIPNEIIADGLRNKGLGMQVWLKSKVFAFLEPKTKIPVSDFLCTKEGYLMPYIPEATNLSLLRDSRGKRIIRHFPHHQFEELAILDLSLCNVDRNLENLLVSEKRIFWIDQGLLLPSGFQSPCMLAWALWDQAQEPFSTATLSKIRALNFEEDAAKIRVTYPNYPSRNLETMRISYYLLKKGAEAGLTPFQIACFITGNPDSCTGSALGLLYTVVRSRAKEEPDVVYAQMTKAIDIAIVALKESFEKIKSASEESSKKIEQADSSLFESSRKCLQDDVQSFLIMLLHKL